MMKNGFVSMDKIAEGAVRGRSCMDRQNSANICFDLISLSIDQCYNNPVCFLRHCNIHICFIQPFHR